MCIFDYVDPVPYQCLMCTYSATILYNYFCLHLIIYCFYELTHFLKNATTVPYQRLMCT